MGERQRPHQHVIGKRERRRRRTHSERGDDNRRQREAGGTHERADGVAQILAQRLERHGGPQSARSARIGEIRDARMAGITPAAIATTSSTAAAIVYVHGSLRDTPNSSEARTDDTAIAAAMPATAPVKASRSVS